MKKKIYQKPSIKEHKLQHYAYLLAASPENPADVNDELLLEEVDEAW